MDNEPDSYNWAYEKRVNSFCHDLAVELRILTGREVKTDPQDLPTRVEPKATTPVKES